MEAIGSNEDYIDFKLPPKKGTESESLGPDFSSSAVRDLKSADRDITLAKTSLTYRNGRNYVKRV
jgi:hypothetical protein